MRYLIIYIYELINYELLNNKTKPPRLTRVLLLLEFTKWYSSSAFPSRELLRSTCCSFKSGASSLGKVQTVVTRADTTYREAQMELWLKSFELSLDNTRVFTRNFWSRAGYRKLLKISFEKFHFNLSSTRKEHFGKMV